MSTTGLLTDEEINALVQVEAGNTQYFKVTQKEMDEIRSKIKSNDINEKRYLDSKKMYEEINHVLKEENRGLPLWKVAACIAFLIIGSLATIFWLRESEQLTDVYIELTDEELLSENFQLNDEFENYVNSPMRSGGFQIIKPTTGIVLSGRIVIEWAKTKSSRLTLKIYNNNQKSILQQDVIPHKVTIDQEFSSGVYYWSLENADEIIHWGKFYYKNNRN